MYHHRYQPQASHLANRNTSAFASNNHHSSSASASIANNQVSAEAAGQRNIVASNSSSGPHNKNNFNFGNHSKPGTNSVYHSGAYSSQPRQFAEERQDVIFRRVRGILNKITPETFDKLSKELVNVGLDSPRTLRGLIYLLFDKALKDLKYSSLYAKLCQQLSEKAPNFEQDTRGPNTFCKFLISKCEDEFERRRKATEDFDGKNELTDEEFEQKAIAKQKMLGNIKFICELGKKRLLQEEILHECIRGLLSKKKERPIQDQAQDLECLCQIMRTIGSLLDIQASRNLMNQYFERIDMYSKKPELPSRIRFMLRDVIDLRNNKWRPRPFQREDNVPQPLSRLREEAGFNNSSNTSIDNVGNTKNLMNKSDSSKMHGSKVSSLLIDDDGPSFTTTTDFHWGSNTFLPNETEFDIFSSNMPSCNKLGSSINAPGVIRTNSTSLSTNTNSTAAVSKHTSNQLTSVSQVKHETYVHNNNNNGMSNIHNRIDPFSDSFKTDKFGQNNRIPMQRENIFGMHGHQEMDRNTDGARRNLAREPLLPPPQSAPVLVKPKDINLATNRINREAPPMGQLRGNLHSNTPQGHRGPPARDDNPNHVLRRPIVDSPRPPPQRRGGDLSPAPRFANPQRHLDDMPPPPPPPAEQNVPHHPHQHQNPPRNPRHGMDADHRPEPRFSHGVTNGNQVMRGRRFDRNDERFENESREPKFSGSNYRLPGREIRQPSREQQNFNRNNHQTTVSRQREDVERRNFRPAFGRNQSFDAQNTVDSNRDHDWRKEAHPNPVKKDQTPSNTSLVSSPLLTKPAIRTSETDFSLRPSHNLGGRVYSETLTQTQTTAKSNETNSSVTNNNVNLDARFAARSQVDVTPVATQNIDNKETEKNAAANDDNSKGATKDFYVSKFNSFINQHSSDIPKIVSKMKELKIPKNYHSECLISAMKQSIIGSESDRENTSKLLVGLVPSIVDPSSLLSVFRVIFEQLNALEAETPKVKSLVAEFLSRAVFDGLLALEEVGGVLIGGKHHPLFLLLLQKLEKKGGQAWLVEKFVASKINLMDMLPEADRSEERLATALKDRCLGFLDPMLTIEPDLWAQMMRDPSPGAIYRWIKENVDQTIQNTPTFAHVLIACMLKYINSITSERFKGNNNDRQQKDLESDDSNKSSPTNSSSQGLIDLEKELLSKYQQILQAFLKDKQMQLATLYALQSFYHGLDFPKGALLRWFHMLYDLSIVDDDVFFIWKEEINDEFPGKGQALFQVNTWLNWLAEPDSEDEDEV